VTNIIWNTAPFWAAILGYFFFGDALHKVEVIAMICSFGGILLLSFSKKTVVLDID
jgi:drug/metabolite transporter (DMT)-like permease